MKNKQTDENLNGHMLKLPIKNPSPRPNEEGGLDVTMATQWIDGHQKVTTDLEDSN